jgi:hypothetical protein
MACQMAGYTSDGESSIGLGVVKVVVLDKSTLGLALSGGMRLEMAEKVRGGWTHSFELAP